MKYYLTLVFVLGIIPLVSATDITLQSSVLDAYPGQTFTLTGTWNVANVSSSERLIGGYETVLLFDPSVIQLIDVAESSFSSLAGPLCQNYLFTYNPAMFGQAGRAGIAFVWIRSAAGLCGVSHVEHQLLWTATFRTMQSGTTFIRLDETESDNNSASRYFESFETPYGPDYDLLPLYGNRAKINVLAQDDNLPKMNNPFLE